MNINLNVCLFEYECTIFYENKNKTITRQENKLIFTSYKT